MGAGEDLRTVVVLVAVGESVRGACFVVVVGNKLGVIAGVFVVLVDVGLGEQPLNTGPGGAPAAGTTLLNLNAGPVTPGTGSASSCSQLEEMSPATRLSDTDTVTVEDQLTRGVKPLQPEAGMLLAQELAKHAMCASVTAPGYSTIAARSPLRMVGWLT